jgi:glycosyltransferase involved in cell wall biosynthesis
MIKKSKERKISLIMPAYRAERTVKESLLSTKEVLDKSGYDYEIICVVDGKLDRTWQEARKIERKFPKLIKVAGYKNNLGKGHAVRFGMAKSSGEIVGFLDVGLDLNTNGLRMLLSHFEWYNADIMIGSKRHPVSKVTYPWQRRIMSYGYQFVVRVLFGLKVKDTQVGMKFFRREVLEKTLPRLLVKAFAFDVEMLAVANYLGYTRIYEAPIDLSMEFETSSIASKGFARTIYLMLVDTLAVFYRLRILHYYDNNNRKNWITPEYLTLKTSK